MVRILGNSIVYVDRAGEIRLSILDNVMYTVHGIVPEDVASRAYDENFSIEGLNQSVSSAGPVESDPEELDAKHQAIIDIRRECCRALRNLEKKIDKCHSVLTKAGSYNLYYRLKHPDPQRSAQVTIEQALKLLLGQNYPDDQLMAFALHQQLMANADMFLANAREMRDGSTFTVQSFHTLVALYTVRDWIDQDSIQLKAFVEKCKTIIQARRSQHADTNRETPVKHAPVSFPPWTSTDQMFIQVFQTIATNQRLIQDQPYSTVAAYILKRIGLYDSEAMVNTWPSLTFDRFGAIALLRDLGILPAWQTVGLWDPDLDLTPRISEQYNIMARSHDNPANLDITPSAKTSKIKGGGDGAALTSKPILSSSSPDPIDPLRYDFGKLPAYIIDDPGAQELDDGISIEVIDESVDNLEAWVHVHVADPTSHLGPSDPISLKARAYLDTIYLPGFTLPMLPSHWIDRHRMSLGSNDKSGRPVYQRTLSFSARINNMGEILDYKIRPGLINNPKQLTYQVVSEILDGPRSTGERMIHVGPDSDRMASTEQNAHRNLTVGELDHHDRKRLRQLGRISQILTQKRVKDGAMGWHLPIAQVSVKSHPLVSPSIGIPHSPRITIGTPSISISLPSKVSDYKNHSWGMNSAQILVSEMMIMAGRLAGRFYVDSKGSSDETWEFKLPFRSQPSPDLVGSAQNEQTLKELRRQIDPKTGLISPFKFSKSRLMFMPAVNGLEPMDHFPLGINDRFGYCKVTSPLRRYSDLVAHWQIKTAIARSHGRATYEDRRGILSAKGMSELIDRLDRDRKPIINLERKMNLSWICYVLRRILNEDRTGELPKSFKLYEVEGQAEDRIEFLDLIDHRLTAIILQDPVLMRFSNRWSFKVYIPELGLRASLIVDQLQPWFSKWVDDRRRGPAGALAVDDHHSPDLRSSSSSSDPYRSQADDGDDADHDPVGLRVPVKIFYINQEDHLILRLDSNRPNFTIHSTV